MSLRAANADRFAMDGNSPTSSSHDAIPWLTTPQQKLIALVIVASQLGVAGWWLAHGGMTGGLIRLDQATPLECPTHLDINRCGWPELTLLPGISETMARRIVRNRQQHGHFGKLEELRRVRGIGPKRLAQLRPHLVCHDRADEPPEKP